MSDIFNLVDYICAEAKNDCLVCAFQRLYPNHNHNKSCIEYDLDRLRNAVVCENIRYENMLEEELNKFTARDKSIRRNSNIGSL